MGVISDAIDALEDWCCDLFKDGIKSQFDGISDLLTDTFAQTTGSGAKGNLVSNFLTKHPAQFTGTAGSAPTGYGIWATIETLCNNVVVPIGGFILTVILLNELCQMVIRGNNFKDFDDSIFIKWIIKALCGVILVANTYYIASALFSFGTNVCSNGLATLFGSGDYLSKSLALKKSALNSLGLGELMTVWFISLIVHLGVMILIVAIVITLASRIIEVFMYLSIAPIPMATMMDSGEWASIGKNWVKQLLALSFQGFYCMTASYDGAVLYNTLERKQRTMVAEPIPINTYQGTDKSRTVMAGYHKYGEATIIKNPGFNGGTTAVATPVRIGHYGKGGQGQRIYSVAGKSVTLSANGGGQGAKTGLYKIDLPDGDYVIRKLTPVEAERLQTLPDNYTAGISNTQRYKCIGNGWTVDVIAHILGGLHND